MLSPVPHIIRAQVPLRSDRINLAFAQLDVALKSSSAQAPYRVDGGEQALAKVQGAIDCASDLNAHILAFPEMSISVDWLEGLITRFADHSYPNFMILPLEHLPLQQAQSLFSRWPDAEVPGKERTELFEQGLPAFESEYFVNVAMVVWRQDGQIKVAYQPKICPNKHEQPQRNRTMQFLRGNTARIISADGYRLATAICYDLIGRTTYRENLQELEGIQNVIFPEQVDLLVLPQLNEKPRHSTFLRAIHRFYERRPHQHQSTTLMSVNVSAVSLDQEPRAVYGRSSVCLPYSDPLRYTLAKLESELQPEGGDPRRVTLPSPIQMLSPTESGEWLLFLQTARAAQYHSERPPDFDHSFLVRLFWWKQGGWCLPDAAGLEEKKARNELRSLLLKSEHDPEQVASGLAFVESDVLEVFARNARRSPSLEPLRQLVAASTLYWRGDLSEALTQTETLSVTPGLELDEQYLVATLGMWAAVGLEQRLSPSFYEWIASLLSMVPARKHELPGEVLGGFIHSTIAYRSLIEERGWHGVDILGQLLANPSDVARCLAVEAFAEWRRGDPRAAASKYHDALKALDDCTAEDASSPTVVELRRWWNACIARLETGDGMNWLEHLRPVNAAASDQPAQTMGPIERAWAQLSSRLQADTPSNEFSVAFHRLRHLALAGGIWRVFMATYNSRFRRAVNVQDVDEALLAAMWSQSLGNQQRHEAETLVYGQDPSTKALQVLLPAIARRVANRGVAASLRRAALFVLELVYPWLPDQELSKTLDASSRVLHEPSPTLVSDDDARSAAFSIYVRAAHTRMDSLLERIVEDLTRWLVADMRAEVGLAEQQPSFADAYHSHEILASNVGDYRDPLRFTGILGAVLEGLAPAQAQRVSSRIVSILTTHVEAFRQRMGRANVGSYRYRNLAAMVLEHATHGEATELWTRLFGERLVGGKLTGSVFNPMQESDLVIAAVIFKRRPDAVPAAVRSQVMEALQAAALQRPSLIGEGEPLLTLYGWGSRLGGDAAQAAARTAAAFLALETRKLPPMKVYQALLALADPLPPGSPGGMPAILAVLSELQPNLIQIAGRLVRPEAWKEDPEREDPVPGVFLLGLGAIAKLRGYLRAMGAREEELPAPSELKKFLRMGLMAPDESPAEHAVRGLGEVGLALATEERDGLALLLFGALCREEILVVAAALVVAGRWAEFITSTSCWSELSERIRTYSESPSSLLRQQSAYVISCLGAAFPGGSEILDRLRADRSRWVRTAAGRTPQVVGGGTS